MKTVSLQRPTGDLCAWEQRRSQPLAFKKFWSRNMALMNDDFISKMISYGFIVYFCAQGHGAFGSRRGPSSKHERQDRRLDRDWWIWRTGGSQDLAGSMARLFGAEGATKSTPKLSMLSILSGLICSAKVATEPLPGQVSRCLKIMFFGAWIYSKPLQTRKNVKLSWVSVFNCNFQECGVQTSSMYRNLKGDAQMEARRDRSEDRSEKLSARSQKLNWNVHGIRWNPSSTVSLCFGFKGEASFFPD